MYLADGEEDVFLCLFILVHSLLKVVNLSLQLLPLLTTHRHFIQVRNLSREKERKRRKVEREKRERREREKRERREREERRRKERKRRYIAHDTNTNPGLQVVMFSHLLQLLLCVSEVPD